MSPKEIANLVLLYANGSKVKGHVFIDITNHEREAGDSILVPRFVLTEVLKALKEIPNGQ